MSAIILAGGKSSRMGRDKSIVVFDGEPLLLRATKLLSQIFDEIIIVTNQEIPFQIQDAKIINDEIPHQGPLGGLNAGLKASKNDRNFAVAVDMPFISESVIDYLATHMDGAAAVVPLTANGLEPLFAIYSKSCLPAIEEVLQQGERKILAMLSKIPVKVIGLHELHNVNGASDTFMNVNTERDLEEAEAKTKPVLAPLDDFERDIRMPTERAVTIFVNDEELVTMQTSMEHLDELACGFLVAEGLLKERSELEGINVDAERGEVWIKTSKERAIVREELGKRFITSGCGKGFSFVSVNDAMGMSKLTNDFTFSASEMPLLMKEFLIETGRPGMHSSAVVRGGEIAFVRQDIGRHNTIDMILGRLWLDDNPDRNIMLFTTGRISYEMMVKAAKARIPIVVSRTAATDLAVELAKKIGIELIGYVRAGTMHVYTNGARLR